MTTESMIRRTLRACIVLAACTLLAALAAPAQTITVTADAQWTDITSGSGPGGLPGSSDTVVISSGAILSVNIDSAACAAFRIGNGTGPDNGAGTLELLANSSTTVGGPVVLGDASGTGAAGTLVMLAAGGTLRCARLETPDPDSASISGSPLSTLVLTGPGTLGAPGTGAFPAVTIDGAGVTLAGDITLLGQLTLTGSASFDLDTFDLAASDPWNTLIASAGSMLMVGGHFPRNFSTVSLDAASEVVYDGAGQTVNEGDYGKLTLAGTGTKTLAGNITSHGTLTIDGVTLECAGNNLAVKGDLTNSGGSLLNENAVFFSGSAHQTVTGVPSFNYISMAAPAGVTIDSAYVGDIWLIDGVLAVTGKVTLGLVSGWTKTSYIKGRVCIARTEPGDAVYPVGDAGLATVAVSFPAAGSATVSAVAGTPGGLINGNNALPRWWQIESDLSSAPVTLYYPSGDVRGAESQYVAALHQDTLWDPIVSSSVNTVDHRVFIPNAALGATLTKWAVGVPGALPIQYTGITGTVDASAVTLTWSTLTETNNYGFYIERRKEGTSVYETVSGLIAGAGTTLEEQQYAWSDEHAPSGTWYYRLKQVDLDGAMSWSEEITIVVSGALGVTENKPLVYALGQNYPNPFNPSTEIGYRTPEAGHVTLTVYNVLGEKVATLINEVQPAGEYTATWNAASVPSGLYLYTLHAGAFTEVRKMLLVR